EAAGSAWTEDEWTSVHHRERSEGRTRLGFLLLREHPVPELLRTKIYADARTDPQRGLRDIVEWLCRQRDMRRTAEAKTAVRLPAREPQRFVGRVKYLEDLYKALVESEGVFLLHGEPGSGKSTLALKFAWRFRSAFAAVVFQPCGQRPASTIAAD